jgi:hypothetical protein
MHHDARRAPIVVLRIARDNPTLKRFAAQWLKRGLEPGCGLGDGRACASGQHEEGNEKYAHCASLRRQGLDGKRRGVDRPAWALAR